jgi:hypothetical protein
MKKEAIGTYEVLAGTKHLGFVSAISLATAVAKAVRQVRPVRAMSSLRWTARPVLRTASQRPACSRPQRRPAAIPRMGFEARRAALVAEFEAAQ